MLVLGVLIGLAIDGDEPDRDLSASEASTTTTTARSTTVAPDTAPTTERADSTAGTAAAPPARKPTTTARRATATPTTTTRAATTTRPSERIVGRTAGGGSGNGSTSISFEVSGKWRIDHVVKGAEATITVIDRAAGYSFSYTAPVGSGSRVVDRTCGCRIVVSSPEGTYDVTVVDTAD